MQQTPEILCTIEQYRVGRQRFVQQGGLGTKPSPPPLLIHHRLQLINDFTPINDSRPRLDFQLYEHDLPSLMNVLEKTLEFVSLFRLFMNFSPVDALFLLFVGGHHRQSPTASIRAVSEHRSFLIPISLTLSMIIGVNSVSSIIALQLILLAQEFLLPRLNGSTRVIFHFAPQ